MTEAKKDFMKDDAREMAKILQTAHCIARYDKISHELLAEILVASVLDGFVEGGNRRGSDVWASAYGRIEVKSRILGTDGPFPRVSLRPSNLEKADYFVALRWTRAFEFHDAVMLPKDDVLHLHQQKQQQNGMAHIKWEHWCASPNAVSLRDKIQTVLSS